jgi:hypothetical protein
MPVSVATTIPYRGITFEKKLTHSAAPSSVFKEWVRKRGFLRQARDTESIEVHGQP